VITNPRRLNGTTLNVAECLVFQVYTEVLMAQYTTYAYHTEFLIVFLCWKNCNFVWS